MTMTAAVTGGVYTYFLGWKFGMDFFQTAVTYVLEGLERSVLAQTTANELNFRLSNVLPLPRYGNPQNFQVQK